MKNIAILFITLIMVSCGSQKNIVEQEADRTQALNGKWILNFIDGASLENQNEIPYLEFQVTEKTLSGKDGCNMISGSIEEVSNSTIKFGPIMGTKMACMNMDIPNIFHLKLAEVKTYNMLSSMLTGKSENAKKEYISFYNEEGLLILSFVKVE